VVAAAIAVTTETLAGIHFFKWNVLKAVAATGSDESVFAAES